MEKIGGFFDKFRNKAALIIQTHDFVVLIIKKVTGIELDPRDVGISGGVLKINSSSIIKNEIFIKKTRILKEINQKIKNANIIDIR